MLNIEKMLKELLFCLSQCNMACFDECRNHYIQNIETLIRALKIDYDLTEKASTQEKIGLLINTTYNVKGFLEKIDNR